jgi:NAD(P)-dependent dehydrogenase (short-subunit alcohol dehydrogenase family)
VSPTAVVTGGSGGIGRAVAAELRERGWEVVSLSRREGCDISDEAQVRGTFGRMERLDALINCAAQLIKRPILELTADDWDAQPDAGRRWIDRHGLEPFRCCRR